MKGLITAIQTLTILPVRGKGSERFASSLPWFPLVGFLVGLPVWALARWGGVWPAGAAALAVALSALLTRALHLDGLADAADGVGGGHTREKMLAIMKDPHTGAFGTIALIAVLLLQWVAYARLIETAGAGWVLAAFVFSRAMQVELACTLPYAREDGTAAEFVRGAQPWHRFVALALGACGVLFVRPAFHAACAFVAVWIAIRLYGAWCRKRAGGITGDLIGAGSVLAETAVLLAGGLIV